MTEEYEYQIMLGATPETMVNLESLGMPAPKVEYQPYVEAIELGDGSIRGWGLPIAVLRWGFLPQADRDTLRTYCTGASAEVYVRLNTTDSADEWRTFQAIMVWPTAEVRDAARRLNFDLLFKQMIIQAEPEPPPPP